MKKSLKEVEQAINYDFKEKNLLHKALTHKSYDNLENNEKLEFLGDRVLGLVISKILLEKFPEEKEGIIDKKFANLVNKKTCTEIAKKLNIRKFLYLGSSYKNLNSSSKSSTPESAIICLIFLKYGLSFFNSSSTASI